MTRKTLNLITAMLILLFFIPAVKGRELPIGHWQHHLPNRQLIALAESESQIIGATPYGLIVFNKEDNSLEKINKVHGLSDFGISSLEYAPQPDLVIIGYSNGNIDIIRQKTTFINIPDIKMSDILGSKSINSIKVIDNRAFLSCGFGVVELDLETYLILDTWFIGPGGTQVEVMDLENTSTHFYAATNAGLLRAPLQGVNLADYSNWQKEDVASVQGSQVFNHLAVIDNKVLANRDAGDTDTLYLFDEQSWQVFTPGSYDKKRNLVNSRGYLMVCSERSLHIYDQDLNLVQKIEEYDGSITRPYDALYDEEGMLWIADTYFGLVRENNQGGFDMIILSGPGSANSFGLLSAGGITWVAPGGISTGGNSSWNQDGIFKYEDNNWTTFNRFRFPQMQPVSDIIRLAADPANPSRVFAATWSEGVLAVSPDSVGTLWNDQNSTLERRYGVGDQVRVSDVAVDRKGNLWVANSQVEHPLHVMKEDGQWMTFSVTGLVNPGQLLGDMIIDRQDQKWIVLPQNGLLVFKENSLENNNDFDARRLTTQENIGGLPSNNIYSLAVDHDGYIWTGTDKGVAIFYTPQRAVGNEPINAQQIIVEQDGFGAILLGTETVSAITIDGANKKWIGTTRSGAFLLSADGRETIFHFNTDNSPLPSNHIYDISVNHENGEVFFATEEGLVSFRGLATGATATHSDVYAYPNPVKPHYEGYIAIKGLVRNAFVKITDINGQLVYETIAEGGQAIWNGRDLHGRRPATGVYLVFSTNDDGSETMVTKIMFIN